MKVLDRYAEYAIIGVLFWVGLFALGTVIDVMRNDGDAFTSWEIWINHFSTIFSKLGSNSASSIIIGISSAVGVTMIFCTGMLIDIICPAFFILVEIWYFKKYFLAHNDEWINLIFLGDQKSALYRDYVHLKSAPSLFSKNYHQWRFQRRRYSNILTFITIYCLMKSEGAVLDYLKDRLLLWKTGRAVGGTIFLLTLTMLLINYQRAPISFLSILFILVIPVLWSISVVFAMGQYMRMCSTFSSIIQLEKRNLLLPPHNKTIDVDRQEI